MIKFYVWSYAAPKQRHRNGKKTIEYAGPNGKDAFDAAMEVVARKAYAIRVERFEDGEEAGYADTELPASFDGEKLFKELFGLVPCEEVKAS